MGNAKMEIPIYLFLGFLESGKTTFIQDTLQEDYFADGQKTLLVACEEGEEEYDSEILKEANCVLEVIEEEEDFTMETLKNYVKEHMPERVIIEYNGMWNVADGIDVIQDADLFELYQIITLVNAQTFQVYMNNMRSLAVETFKYAEMAIMNRCTPDMDLGAYKRTIRSANRRLQVMLEMADGYDDVPVEESLPYEIDAPMIELQDDDFGIWYMDAMDHPERYDGKEIHMKTMVYKPQGMEKGIIIPGRFAMTCCEDDVQFLGVTCKLNHVKSKTMKTVKNRDWIMLTARIACEYNEEYEEKEPVLYASRIEIAEKPEDDLIYFV